MKVFRPNKSPVAGVRMYYLEGAVETKAQIRLVEGLDVRALRFRVVLMALMAWVGVLSPLHKRVVS